MIYQAVGHALTMWELTDQALANIFIAMTSCDSMPSYLAVKRAYGSIHGNAGRRAAVEAAAEVHFSPYWDNKEVWQSVTNIVNAIQWASKRRDDIAHGVTWGGSKLII